MMSLWWAKREQLDEHQARLIEDLHVRENHLVLGPPGSGKTNVLLRRAQYVRTQDMPNVQVLTFTRTLTEFIKTGCHDATGRQIFPPKLVNTVESWMRRLYAEHEQQLPTRAGNNLTDWKRALANGARPFRRQGRLPKLDAIFIDEAQDLLPEEVELFAEWGQTLFFVGDDKQRIYGHGSGLPSIRCHVSPPNVHTLEFHYRLAPAISQAADRILISTGANALASTGHYSGPAPGRIELHGPLPDDQQLAECADTLKQQLRVYSDLIEQGDRLGVVVALRDDRERVHNFLEQHPELSGKSKVARARSDDPEEEYEPDFGDLPISIVTVQGCKGLEFRAVHWLFCERNSYHHDTEHYYTVVTRAKTRLDLYYNGSLPQELARAHAPKGGSIW